MKIFWKIFEKFSFELYTLQANKLTQIGDNNVVFIVPANIDEIPYLKYLFGLLNFFCIVYLIC